MAPAQAEFIKAVRGKLGMTQTELGVALRIPNAYAKVHAWESGRAKLGYEHTMRMLELCGWVNMSEDQPSAEAARRHQVDARLEELAEGQADVLERQAAGTAYLQNLEDRLRAVEQQLELDGAAQTRGTPGRGSRVRGTDKR